MFWGLFNYPQKWLKKFTQMTGIGWSRYFCFCFGVQAAAGSTEYVKILIVNVFVAIILLFVTLFLSLCPFL